MLKSQWECRCRGKRFWGFSPTQRATGNWITLRVGAIVSPEEHTNCLFTTLWLAWKLCIYKWHFTDWAGHILIWRYICIYIHMHICINNWKKEAMNLSRDVHRRCWREEKEGGSDIIILWSQTIKKIMKKLRKISVQEDSGWDPWLQQEGRNVFLCLSPCFYSKHSASHNLCGAHWDQ